MSDYVYVNILNEGTIPWIYEKGPKLAYYVSAGIYKLLARDPRVQIELATPELVALRKKEIELKAIKKENENRITKANLVVEKGESDADDEMIDAILAAKPVEMMKVDIANAPEQILDADGMAIYTDEQLETMTKKELKKILESRGHAAGQRFVKTDDPFSPMYHDSVEDLREKVRKSQETF